MEIKNSLKIKSGERFSGAPISAAKKLLWDSCAQALRSLNLSYQQRRDSDKRKQLTADIEDLLLAFDALDTNNSIPSMYCEAGDLYKLPPISFDPLAEQVEKNSQVLTNLTSAVQCLELSSCFLPTSNQRSEDRSPEQMAESNTYAGRGASLQLLLPLALTPSGLPSQISPLSEMQTLFCSACLKLIL